MKNEWISLVVGIGKDALGYTFLANEKLYSQVGCD